MEQRSEAWFDARIGKITASRMSDLMARTQRGWGASRANYAAELLVERLTGRRHEGFQNAAMLHGTETEPFARQAYSERFGVDVYEVGFIPHPEILRAGASPDGFIGEDGLIEIKCPQSATHLDTLVSGRVAEKHILQMQFQMACSGRAFCDFVSFDPRCPEHLRLFVQRVQRDHSLILELEGEVVALDREIEARIAELQSRYGERQAA